jgi:hypothetical protein
MTLTNVVWFVITCTGWRYDQVLEDMDLVRLKEMTDYHRDSPPLHLMVRNYLGFGGKGRPKAVMEEQDVVELAKHAPLTTSAHLAVYKGGRIPKIGESLWPTTPST